MNEITVFKIRIDEVSNVKIGFELFVGDHVRDTYVNVLRKGGYGTKSGILLTPREFTDFAIRLMAYTYTTNYSGWTDEQLKIAWNLRINIFDHESPKLSNSVFITEKYRMEKLGLTKSKK
jgi:hypothetical protein